MKNYLPTIRPRCLLSFASMKNEYSVLQSLAVQTTFAHIQLVKTNHIIQQTVREAGAYILDITPF